MIRELFSEDLKADKFGHKARNLNQLRKHGFNVPSGFALSYNYIPTDEEIAGIVSKTGFPVAARSSGLAEDSADASFAGQYESRLHLNSIPELKKALAEVTSSSWNLRVQNYAKSKNIEAEGLGIIIQCQVDSAFAGVVFTLNPMSGREEEILIEYVSGFGDKLVEGKVQPTTLVIDRNTLEIKEIRNASQTALPESKVRELAQTSIKIQSKFQSPQDIEWAIDTKGELFVLQSRPITSYCPRNDVDLFTNADLKDGGVSARVTCPMMNSLYCSTFSPSMEKYLQDIRLRPKNAAPVVWMKSFYGRLYWNASETKTCLKKIPGFDEKKFDEDLGLQVKYDGEPHCTPTNLTTIMGAIPVAISLSREFSGHLKSAKPWIENFKVSEKFWREEISKLPSKTDEQVYIELMNVLERFYDPTERYYFRTIFNCANSQTEFHDKLKKINKLLKKTVEIPELIAGVNNISHMEYQSDLIALARSLKKDGIESGEFLRALGQFQDRNYYHSEAELDLMTPRFQEDLQFVIRLADSYAQRTAFVDPKISVLEQEEKYQALLQELRSQIGWWKFSGFKFQLERVRKFLVLRERIRDCSTRAYGIVRFYLVEYGQRLKAQGIFDQADDIFFLQMEELETPQESWREKIPARRLYMEGYRNFSPPNEVGQGLIPKTRKDFMDENSLGWKGLGASPGQVCAPVRIIHDLSEVGTIRPGEILVTRFTDPGWTPVLGMVKGVITEVGGVLTHAAVISREFGIPAVLNVEGITKELKTGQVVQLDGSLGRITLVDVDDNTQQSQTQARQPTLQ